MDTSDHRPSGHLTDLTLAPDADLVARVRAGDRIAFGVLYLRHHEAAWRVACSVTGFSDDAEVALLVGFTTVFEALPPQVGETVLFRPFLLACVRQAGLDRLPRRSGAAVAATPASDNESQPSEIVLDDEPEVVLTGMEHHTVRSALQALPEQPRTALWLTDVEGMTPLEVAALVELELESVTQVVADARAAVRDRWLDAALSGALRSGCQFTVTHLGPYIDGGLSRPERLHVKAHLDRCPTCRMRRAEVAQSAQSLARAVPTMPLLGGECQRHWMDHSADATYGPRRTFVLPPALPSDPHRDDSRRLHHRLVDDRRERRDREDRLRRQEQPYPGAPHPGSADRDPRT